MTNPELIRLGVLLENGWFSQVWSVQHVAFAREAVVICGKQEVRWEDLCDAVGLVMPKRDTVRRPLPSFQSSRRAPEKHKFSSANTFFSILSRLFLKSASGDIIAKRLSLETLVTDLALLQATDSRDKIFALLGLAIDTEPLFQHLDGSRGGDKTVLIPDYKNSVSSVSIKFVDHCVQTSGCLDILCRPWAQNTRSKWNDLVFRDFPVRSPSWISVLDDLPFGDPIVNGAIRVNGD